MGGPELAFFDTSPDSGFALRYKTVGIDTEQAYFLPSQLPRNQ